MIAIYLLFSSSKRINESTIRLFTRIVNKKDSSGDLSGREIPGPIPNPEVKPVSADGTGGTHRWESRSLPGRNIFLFKEKSRQGLSFTAIFFFYSHEFANAYSLMLAS